MARIYYLLNKIIVYFFCFRQKIGLHNFCTVGIPHVIINGRLELSDNAYIIMVNTAKNSTLGKCNPCKISVYEDAVLSILGKVGMSNTTIVATKKITIGNNVMIGGGVTIVDTDFHSMNPLHWFTDEDEVNMKKNEVEIGDNVFIGMNSIILKGVRVGNNSIIAAGSVVTKSIPENQIWGGNPAKFIKKLDN